MFPPYARQEIYPPKLHEFAYVTDGACEEEAILEMELVMLKVRHLLCPNLHCTNSVVTHDLKTLLHQALNWNLCPETVITWLKLYAQVESLKDGVNFLVPQFSQDTYIQITQVSLLLTLDCHGRFLASLQLFLTVVLVSML